VSCTHGIVMDCERCSEERVAKLEDMLRNCLTALRDLNNGYQWRELHVNVPQLEAEALALGVEVDA
jgi:hypothetical protein